jgi:hypothetical protein
MLGGMDSSRDPHRTGSLIRHLRAVDTQFLESPIAGLDGTPLEPVGDDFTRRQLDHLEDAEFMSLSIPDAHDLVRKVQAALDTALPATGIREISPW